MASYSVPGKRLGKERVSKALIERDDERRLNKCLQTYTRRKNKF